MQARDGNLYFTELAERVEHGNYVITIIIIIIIMIIAGYSSKGGTVGGGEGGAVDWGSII